MNRLGRYRVTVYFPPLPFEIAGSRATISRRSLAAALRYARRFVFGKPVIWLDGSPPFRP
jgi:hypothetical protein